MNIQIAAATVDDAELVLACYAELLAEELVFIMDNPVPTLAEEIEGIRRQAIKVGDEFRDLIMMAKLLA